MENETNVYAINIKWKTLGQNQEELGLPDEVQLPHGTANAREIRRFLYEKTGYLADSYDIASDFDRSRMPAAEEEETTFMREHDRWIALYMTYNDDNLERAENAFFSNGLNDIPAEDLREESRRFEEEIRSHGENIPDDDMDR
jgi:hypothetical protein